MLGVSGFVGGFGLLLFGLMLTGNALRALCAEPLRAHLLARSGWIGAAIPAGIISAPLQASLAAAVVSTRQAGPGVTGLAAATMLMAAAAVTTTLAGWGIALIGIYPAISPVILPGIAVGALLMWLGKAQVAQWGRLLSGLVLIVLGLEIVFGAMPSVAGYATLNALLGDNALATYPLLALLGLVLAGVVRSTVVVAAIALAGLSVDALSLLQTASLSIGIYAALGWPAVAALRGAPGASRRIAALQLVLHGIAILLGFVGLYILSVVDRPLVAQGLDVTLLAAAFPTVYLLVTLAVGAALARALSARSTRYVAEDHRPQLRLLEPALRIVPSWALDSAGLVLHQTVADIYALLARPLRRTGEAGTRDVARCREVLEATETFLERLGPVDMPDDARRMTRMRQALDHARSLCDDLESVRRAHAIKGFAPLESLASDLGVVLEECAAGLISDGGLPQSTFSALEQNTQRLATVERGARPAILEQVAGYQISAESALAQLAAQRWMERVAVHAMRTASHLRNLSDEVHAHSSD